MVYKIRSASVFVGCLVTLSACSGGGSGSQDTVPVQTLQTTDSSNSSVAVATPDLVGDIPDGLVTNYGAITVGDDAGMASDLVAAFFKFESGVSAEFLTSAFNGDKTLCSVDTDDAVDFEEISVGFIPSYNGISKQAISAGESIVLSSDAGTFATMQSQSAGQFLFYTLPDLQALPAGPVPDTLQVDITGAEFPAVQSALLPNVSTLGAVEYGGGTIAPDTVFTWTPSSDEGSLIRIFSSTAGGFFVENGMTVTCLVPDTGRFTFPSSVQAELGAGFIGGAPIVSRVAVNTRSVENSTLFLIRESFADD